MQPTNNQQPKTQKAFTLIELLVVIAIVGILAGLAVVNMSGATTAAKIAKSKVFANSVNNSLLGNRISEWKFDEVSGSAATDTVGTNNGTLVNSPARRSGSDCVSGGCLEFNGTNNYVSLSSDAVNLANDFTVSFWINKRDSVYDNDRVLSLIPDSSNNFQIITDDVTQKYGVLFNRGGSAVINQSTYSVISFDQWVYIVYSVKGSTGIFYKDGVFSPSNGSTNIGSGTTYNNRIGARGDGTSSTFFNGSIDEVRVYSAAMTASAVRDQYVAGLDKLLANGQITNEDYQQRLANLNSTYATNK